MSAEPTATDGKVGSTLIHDMESHLNSFLYFGHKLDMEECE